MTIHKVYVDTEKLSKEELEQLLINKDKEIGRLQSALDYANRDREDMNNKIIELGNKRESQRNINYKLNAENKKLKKYYDRDKEELSESCYDLSRENAELKKYKSQRTRKIERENRILKEENKLLKQCLDKLMFDSDIVNVQIHGELGDYCYVRSDKKFKLKVKD